MMILIFFLSVLFVLDICVIGLKKDDKHKTSKIVLSNFIEIYPKNNNLFV